MKALLRESLVVRQRRRALPQRHLRTFLTRYALSLVPLVLSAAIALRYPALWSYLLVAAVAGFTQNAFGILMHEGSHGFLHSSRAMNDRLSNWLVCYAIFNTVQGYRAPHLEHHRFCCDDRDPYFGLYGPYVKRTELLQGFLMDFVGVTAIRMFTRRYGTGETNTTGIAWHSVAGLMVVHSVLCVAGFLLTGYWWGYLLLWVIPLATLPIGINRFRTFVEHHAGANSPEANRSTIPNAIEYLAIAPYGYAHHFEHHLMPDIPYYHLGWAHQELRAEGVRFEADRLAAGGYVRTFWRLFNGLR